MTFTEFQNFYLFTSLSVSFFSLVIATYPQGQLKFKSFIKASLARLSKLTSSVNLFSRRTPQFNTLNWLMQIIFPSRQWILENKVIVLFSIFHSEYYSPRHVIVTFAPLASVAVVVSCKEKPSVLSFFSVLFIYFLAFFTFSLLSVFLLLANVFGLTAHIQDKIVFNS